MSKIKLQKSKTAEVGTDSDIDHEDKLFNKLESISKKIHDGFMQNIRETETKAIINRAGSMMTLFFTEKEKVDF